LTACRRLRTSPSEVGDGCAAGAEGDQTGLPGLRPELVTGRQAERDARALARSEQDKLRS